MVKPSLFIAMALSYISFHHAASAATADSSPTTTAQPGLSTAAQQFLDAHNRPRAEVGVGPLTWSDQLFNATSLLVRYQRDKFDCQFANLSAGKYGGNQLWASGQTLTPSMAVEAWVNEKNFYNHTTNSCAPDHQCGVYTQVVWRKSVELGCAQAVCVKNQVSLTICFYNPPGNVVGETPFEAKPS